MLRISRALAVGVLLAACGCGGGDGINHGGELTGKVTIDGTPVSAGEIQFHGGDGKHSVSGKLRNDGSYTVHEPPLGPCKIAIITSTFKDIPPKSKAKGPVDFTDHATGEWPIYAATPKAYEDKDTSGLTVDVKSGKQEHAIELTKSKK